MNAFWVARLGWTLIDFLWQGAAIAIPYGAARAALRHATPQARYALGCAAMLAMLAAPLATWIALQPAGDLPDAVYQIHANPPAPGAPAAVSPGAVWFAAPIENADWQRWIVLAWFAGAMAFGIRLAGGCVVAGRMRSRHVRPAPAEWQRRFDRLRARLGATRGALLVSELVDAPAVVGWYRPVVLAPLGALTGLAPEAVEALLAHELAHIRRHDYLVNAAQSVVETLLFYHPAVWWISGHLRAEREHCCDDAAVAISGVALGYARALAEVEAWRAPAAPVAMSAAGGSLAGRIARLLGRPHTPPSGAAAPALLAAVLAIAVACGLYAQSEARPSFQAASIKRNVSDHPRGMIVRPEPGGRLRTENAPVVLLIQNAYSLQAFQILGGPAWINTDGYDIEAKPEGEASREQMWKMLQTLLADRFRLELRRETRDVPAYALIAAKGGPKLVTPKEGACVAQSPDLPIRPPEPGAPGPCGRIVINMSPSGLRFFGGRVNMTELARILGIVTGRPVLDRTESSAEFDIALTFTPDEITMGLPGAGGPRDPGGMRLPTDPERPTLLAALQEQLGLKLTGAKAPVDVVVIDHVERASEN